MHNAFIELTGLACGYHLPLLHRDSGGGMGVGVHMVYCSTIIPCSISLSTCGSICVRVHAQYLCTVNMYILHYTHTAYFIIVTSALICYMYLCIGVQSCVFVYSREDVREYGFSVIVDARTSNWHSTKLVLHSLQEVLPGQVY